MPGPRPAGLVPGRDAGELQEHGLCGGVFSLPKRLVTPQEDIKDSFQKLLLGRSGSCVHGDLHLRTHRDSEAERGGQDGCHEGVQSHGRSPRDKPLPVRGDPQHKECWNKTQFKSVTAAENSVTVLLCAREFIRKRSLTSVKNVAKPLSGTHTLLNI